jgi:hypothetical protein
VITNDTNHLFIPYDGGGDVTFNTAVYIPNMIRIFKPSLHEFNGTQADAEVVIEHANKDSPERAGLLVCIPISNSGTRNGASDLIENLIDFAPVEKGSTSSAITLANFTLNNVIPQSPYYTYVGPLPYFGCVPAATYQYVVFHPSNNGALVISKRFDDKLFSIINFHMITAYKGRNVFFNPKGTLSNGFNGEDQIYIQCQPAGESGEEKIYKEPKSPFSAMQGNTKDTLTYILCIIIGILCIFFAFSVFKLLTSVLSSDALTAGEFKPVIGGGGR